VNTWLIIQDVVVLLLGATLLGTLFDRFKQDAVLGYLLAGALLGPHVFDLVPGRDAILTVAEIGVALLMFAIGMEFSWRRLLRLGSIALGGGTLQVLITTGLVTGVALGLGLDLRQAVPIGAVIALSSTALVTRLLTERAELDSLHGRNAIGILLLQDIAVVPLVLVVSEFAGGGSGAGLGWGLVRALVLGLLLIAVVALILKHVFSRLIRLSARGTNRDLPALLAVVTAIGCALGAHALGLSPLLGAFAGGVVLAESPFGTQVGADVGPLKAVFVTLFFSAIGTLTNPQLLVEHWVTVGALVAGVVLGKAAIVFALALLFRTPVAVAAATALCLAQIGEFSFVLLEITRSTRLISSEFFELMVTVIVVTLFLSPYLVAAAPRLAHLIRQTGRATDDGAGGAGAHAAQVVLVGFGPAGRAVAEDLMREDISLVLIEWNAALAAKAEALGIDVVIGDGTRADVLTRAGVAGAAVVAVTVPDPAVAGHVTAQARSLARNSAVVVRSRYQRHEAELHAAGATSVSDEETLAGRQVASEVKKAVRAADAAAT
jgi:CPA2 family monovalent cation:H+ antiporter-2